jgi:putative glutathione S-transferase
MGQLVDGTWRKGWYEPTARGAFERPAARFRRWVTEDGRRDGFAAEPGRYRLYASYACPWAHRALVTLAARGLEEAVGVTILDPKMSDEGWRFGGDGDDDPLCGATYLRDVYLRSDPHYSGRVTVPVLWDKKTNQIVNNESREIMRMLDTAFGAFAKGPSLLPPGLTRRVDRMLDRLYGPYNDGVYRAGFATAQAPYEAACRGVFETLERCETILAEQQFLCGDLFTEADIAMFTTSLRFDLVYYSHFKCNLHPLTHYPNVWGFVRDVYQMPRVKPTCRLDHIKTHYYWSQTTVNPSRVVPLGPTIDFDEPHRRDRFGPRGSRVGVGDAFGVVHTRPGESRDVTRVP